MASFYSNDIDSVNDGENIAIAEECPVCSQMAYSKHFGRICCNACSGKYFLASLINWDL